MAAIKKYTLYQIINLTHVQTSHGFHDHSLSCVDCGHNTAKHEIHKIALNVVNDFFKENFTNPRYLIDDSRNNSSSSDPVCFLKFYTLFDDENPILNIAISRGESFKEIESPDQETNLVKDFNWQITALIKKEKTLVKTTSILEKNPDKSPYQLLEEYIIKRIPKRLYNDSQEELEEIVNRSIFRAKNHSEEALAEYMETDDFMSQLAQALRNTDGIENLDKIAIEVINQPGPATLLWITSHLENFVVETIQEKEENKTYIINSNPRLIKSELNEIPKESLSERMTRFYEGLIHPDLSLTSSDDIKITYYPSDKKLLKSKQERSIKQLSPNLTITSHKPENNREINKYYTTSINNIYNAIHNPADSINSRESQKKIAELTETNAKLKKKLEEEAKARKEAEAKAKQKEEEAAKARKELEKELEYYKKIAKSKMEDRPDREESKSKKQKTEEKKEEKSKPSSHPSRPHSKKRDREGEKKR